MKHSIAACSFLAVVFAMHVEAGAQSGPPRATDRAGRSRIYNPDTVEVVQGEVVAVTRGSPTGRGRNGVHLTLQVDGGGTLPVHLGPASYVDSQTVKIASGDRIIVKGSRVTIEGAPVIIAAEVTKGDQQLLLRDAAGVPKWSGGRRRGGPR
jgi:hypothetical protein